MRSRRENANHSAKHKYRSYDIIIIRVREEQIAHLATPMNTILSRALTLSFLPYTKMNVIVMRSGMYLENTHFRYESSVKDDKSRKSCRVRIGVRAI